MLKESRDNPGGQIMCKKTIDLFAGIVISIFGVVFMGRYLVQEKFTS